MRRYLSSREQAALNAFEGKNSLRFCELPSNVGQRTMNRLVARGLIEADDNHVSAFSKNYRWKLVATVKRLQTEP